MLDQGGFTSGVAFDEYISLACSMNSRLAPPSQCIPAKMMHCNRVDLQVYFCQISGSVLGIRRDASIAIDQIGSLVNRLSSKNRERQASILFSVVALARRKDAAQVSDHGEEFSSRFTS